MTAARILALAAALALVVGACGSSKSSTTSTAKPGTSTPATTASSSTATTATATVNQGPVHATLHGESRTPKAGRLWAYSVHATDASGKPLSGTVKTEFVFAGQVVGTETPPTHPLKGGVLKDKVTFPSTAVGEPLTLQTVVTTSAGTVRLDWPVSVQK